MAIINNSVAFSVEREYINTFLINAAIASIIKAPIAKPFPCKCFISSCINSIDAHSTNKLPSTVNIPFSIFISVKIINKYHKQTNQ